jgi:hypothetical protein
VETVFPVAVRPTIYLLEMDTLSRVNGWTQHDHDFGAERGADGQYPRLPAIVLVGKRVPHHPATTRYLIAHEYGHVVEEAISSARGLDPEPGILAEYAALRGLPAPQRAQGGTWHRAAAEIFANDFRLILTGFEREYWPHPGIERPEQRPELCEWWAREQNSAQQAVVASWGAA